MLFRSLKARNYLLYCIGQLASMAGTWAQVVAMSWLVLDLTGSGSQVGGVVAVQYGGLLLASPVAGVLIDRTDRRRAVIGAEAFLAVQAAALAVVVLTDSTQLWMLYLLAATQGIGTAFERPSRQALLSEIVPPRDLPNAIALNGAMIMLAQIAGPAVAGVLIVTVGIGLCFALNALSFVAIIGAVLAMRTAEMFHRENAGAAPGQIREAVRYLFSDRLTRMLILAPLVTGVWVGLSASVYPLLARFTFGGDAGTYGLMATLIGIGAAVAALILARLTEITTRILMLMSFGSAASLLASAVAPTLLVEYLVLPVLGGFTLATSVSALTKLQLTALPRLRGRVVAFYFMLSAAGAAAGGLALGAVAQGWGPRWAIVIDAGLAFCLGLAWKVHRMRTPASADDAPVPQVIEVAATAEP